MAQIVPSTSIEVSGPWLLTLDSLKLLDEIIEDEWKRLHSNIQVSIEHKIEEEYEEKISDSYYDSKTDEELEQIKDQLKDRIGLSYEYEEEKSLEIYFSSGEKLIADTFESVSREQYIVDKNPTGFKLYLRSGKVRCRMDFSPRFGSLDLNVSPSGSRSASELFVSIRRWVIQHRAPLWQRKWSDWAGIQWAVLPLLLLILMGPIFQTNPSKVEARQDAFRLIEKGLSSADTTKALELLLILESNYKSNPSSFIFSPLVIGLFGLIIVILVLLSIRPKVVIGIGKGVEYLSYWNYWLKFISVTIPGLIFFSFIWPMVVDWINSLF